MIFGEISDAVSNFSLGDGDNFDLDSDFEMVDLDGDGIDDSIVQSVDLDGNGEFDSWLIESDFDGDGIIDRTSVIEGFDSDGDGLQDTWSVETDLDGDLIPDESGVMADTNNDGSPDSWLADGGTVSNASLASNTSNSNAIPVDMDGDGINESTYQEIDSDGDGRIDKIVMESDVDGDGVADYVAIQADLNGDGVADQTSVVEISDTNGDGVKDTWAIQTDLNGDLVPDESMTVADTDLDGAADTRLASSQTAVGNASSVGNATPVDIDGDGVNESIYQEMDTDGDGRIDSTAVSTDTDGDGVVDRVAVAVDSDGDGQVDAIAIQSDTDGDGVADETIVAEAADTDGDGRYETWNAQIDRDGDGTFDESIAMTDTDGDGFPDAQLADSQVAVGNANIVGDPENDMAYWHQQTKDDTCAVACQEFILDEMTGRDFTEEELTQQAIENGWYTPGGGTPVEYVGNLLEANGIEIEKEYNCTLEDLSEKLADGENVIVGIDADETWNPGGIDSDKVLANVSGMPEQGANHAVQVIGIDNSDPDNPVVILNDPGHPNGQGIRVDADDFMDAWEDSDNFMVSTVS